MRAAKTLFSLLSPTGSNARLSILIWHRVLAQQDPIFPDEMYAARFDQTLAWVKQTFNVLPLPDAVSGLRQGNLPSRAMAITFDDGYEDNYSVAMPLLKKHHLSATFFITTGFIDGGCMWNDCIIETVRRAPEGMLDAGRFGQYSLTDSISRRQAIDALIGHIKYLEITERQTVVDALAAKAGVAAPQDLMMTADQVRALHASDMTIGAHTRSHPILNRLSVPEAQAEIAEGRAELEAMIGARVGLFAYPNGRPGQDYESQHVEMVRELGFDAAVSTAWGTSQYGDDLFQLRRFSPWDKDRMRYYARLGRNFFVNSAHHLA